MTEEGEQQNDALPKVSVLEDSSRFVNLDIGEKIRGGSSTENKDSTKSSTTPAVPQKTLAPFQLFRYATLWERTLLLFAVVMASVASLGSPFAIVIYGEFTSLLIDRTMRIGASSPCYVLPLFGGGRYLVNASKEENHDAMIEDAKAYGISSLVGSLAMFIVLTVAVDVANFVAMKQMTRIRKLFLESVLRQDMSWYDTTSGNDFASKMTEDANKMKDGMGEKVILFVYLIMTFVIGVATTFLYEWKLSLAVLVCCPLIIISTALVAKIQSSLTEKELKVYGRAGAVADEVFGNIRTVFAFSGERKEIERYANLLRPAEATGRRKGLYSGLGSGIMWFIIFCSYAVAVWYGVELLLADRENERRKFSSAVLVIVVFCIITGAQNLGLCSPLMEAIATAKGSAQTIFAIIDRKSMIDPFDEAGIKASDVRGNIRFQGVHFRYPARPEVEVLKGLNLTVAAGQTVAFVGPSGCGKSTCLQLMQRLYDPELGCVKLDGEDVRHFNVGWLRSQIGVVGQEPVLFATSIKENIRYGNPRATQQDIEVAARQANCHDFIVRLPDGYNTFVGERGAQMSGGQKQRIAIARALVGNPKILLLDEATSALDPTSEQKVQIALEAASAGRTTLVVSHRLSTITNADSIVFVKDGKVIEQGTHTDLITKRGHYYDLVQATKRKQETEYVDRPVSSEPFREKTPSSGGDGNVEGDDDDENEIDEANQNIGNSKPRKKEKYKVSFSQLMKLNRPEWGYILFGCIASFLHGASFPVWAVLFGDFFGILSDSDADYVRSQTLSFVVLFIGTGLFTGLGAFLQTYLLNISGVKLTSRLRQMAFKAIVSQDVAFFDEEKNSVGALCARLSGDCSSVQGATGSRIGVIVQSFSTLVVGILLALYYSWKLTLITILVIPVTFWAIYCDELYSKGSAQKEKEVLEAATQMAVEAIANIRTVTSLNRETQVLQRYSQCIDEANRAYRKQIRFRGLLYSFAQISPIIAYGICISYGGILVANEGLKYENIIKVSEALIFGCWMLAQSLAYAPNINTAVVSAQRLMKLFHRVPAQHNQQQQPFNTIDKTDGDIEYENVEFAYPTRRRIAVLRGLNLTIKRGTTVALVGPSGSGKSTCVQLLLRYYDPTSGNVRLSGTPTTGFTFDTLRSQMGLVSQEPVLFDRTIAENIAYGNNFRHNIPMAEIVEAAKSSNIHDFIAALPNGYETSLGNKGAQLSGGQKQRIAIARALVRNPRILILDEATSALDMQSEKVVQMALDAARSGRTCITIAHRLTTIRDSDLICVMKKGVLVEQGRHDELMRLNGVYADLYAMQKVA